MNKYFHWTSISLFFAAFIYFLFPSWLSLIERWNKLDESYSHGYFVVAISVYYLIHKILTIEPDKIKANYYIAPVLLMSSLVWALSYHAHVEVIHQILLPLMLALFFILVFGFKAGGGFLFPILFLLLAIPFWDYLTVPLQGITVFVNNILLSWVDISVYIEGFFVTIPSGKFEVAGGCSGLRYLIVALTLSILYSYQNYSRWRSRVALLITAVLFALLANWMRVFIIIVVGHITKMESELINNHDFFGWGLFAATLVPIFFLAHMYANWFNDDLPESSAVNGKFENFTVVPYIVAGIVIFTLPLVISPTNSESKIDIQLPALSGILSTNSSTWIEPKFIGSDVKSDEMYNINGDPIQASVRGYIHQKPGKELVYYQNTIFSDAWKLSDKTTENNFDYLTLIHRESGQKLLVARQYSVSGYKVSNPMLAKLLEMFKPLMSSQFSSVFVLATLCQKTCESSKVTIDSFLANNNEMLEAL